MTTNDSSRNTQFSPITERYLDIIYNIHTRPASITRLPLETSDRHIDIYTNSCKAPSPNSVEHVA